MARIDPGASCCADCGAEPSRIHLDGVPLCEGCFDRTSGSGNLIMSGDELRGRLVWREGGMPYGVVVDGRELSWEEFGLALEPFEGWEFRLRIVEGLDDEDDAGAGGGTARSSTIFEPPPDRHAH